MQGKLTGWDDTIVALATPPGIGAIGIIRLSGNKAIGIVNDLFPSKDLAQQASHTIHVGVIKDKEAILDEVVVSIYKTPKIASKTLIFTNVFFFMFPEGNRQYIHQNLDI